MAHSSEPSAAKTVQPVLVRIPPETHRLVKQRAELEERSMAQIIRRALKLYLTTTPG